MNLDQLPGLLTGAFLLWLGVMLNARQEKARWLREWNIGMLQDLRNFAVDVSAAMDSQYLIHHLGYEALRSGGIVSEDRIRASDEAWRGVLARRIFFGTPELQAAMSKFDKLRAESAMVINKRDTARFDSLSKQFEDTRLEVMDAMQMMLNDFNETLASHAYSAAYLWWMRLRGRSVAPIAEMPSRLRQTGGGADSAES